MTKANNGNDKGPAAKTKRLNTEESPDRPKKKMDEKATPKKDGGGRTKSFPIGDIRSHAVRVTPTDDDQSWTSLEGKPKKVYSVARSMVNNMASDKLDGKQLANRFESIAVNDEESDENDEGPDENKRTSTKVDGYGLQDGWESYGEDDDDKNRYDDDSNDSDIGVVFGSLPSSSAAGTWSFATCVTETGSGTTTCSACSPLMVSLILLMPHVR